MKNRLISIGIPTGILAGIFCLCLWSSGRVHENTERWREQIQVVAGHGQAESWPEAISCLADSYRDWTEQQIVLHIIARHDIIDDVETMYQRAMTFAAQRESSEFQAELSDLRDQLRLLAEGERFSLGNIL